MRNYRSGAEQLKLILQIFTAAEILQNHRTNNIQEAET